MKNSFIGIHLDFIGFSASIVCAIHCAVLPFLISALPFLGLGILGHPWVEHSIVIISFVLAVFALSHGYRAHHRSLSPLIIVTVGFLVIGYGLFLAPESLESVITPTGALIVGISHYINWVKIKKTAVQFPGCENHPH